MLKMQACSWQCLGPCSSLEATQQLTVRACHQVTAYAALLAQGQRYTCGYTSTHCRGGTTDAPKRWLMGEGDIVRRVCEVHARFPDNQLLAEFCDEVRDSIVQMRAAVELNWHTQRALLLPLLPAGISR